MRRVAIKRNYPVANTEQNSTLTKLAKISHHGLVFNQFRHVIAISHSNKEKEKLSDLNETVKKGGSERRVV